MLLFLAPPVAAQGERLFGEEPRAPVRVVVTDRPDDNGCGVILHIYPAPEPRAAEVVIRRRSATDKQAYFVGSLRLSPEMPAPYQFVDDNFSWEIAPKTTVAPAEAGLPARSHPQNSFTYEVVMVSPEGVESDPFITEPISPKGELFNRKRLLILIAIAVFGPLLITFIYSSRKGKKLYVRPIAGLQAVDEAVGRATEMGRPILFVAGLDPVSSISTIAAMNVLGRIARFTARYETPLLVPCHDPIVMSALREVVKEAYLAEGKLDSYREENIFFSTTLQFAYVANVAGLMQREKPAANFYFGYFYAESLILAEAGTMAGSIQIAGTDAVTQLPFFVTTCDFTLMGEELYAATAYLSQEPLLLGSLKGQDYCKLLLVVLMCLGIGLKTMAALAGGTGWLATAAQTFVDWFAKVG